MIGWCFPADLGDFDVFRGISLHTGRFAFLQLIGGDNSSEPAPFQAGSISAGSRTKHHYGGGLDQQFAVR
jgi:hypothetical protein